jgi:mannose-6-phosphate isomerase-like protein (cupin superfamily)
MFIAKLSECHEFISGDGAILRELLHPDKADLKLRYSLAHAIVKPGNTTMPHRLKTSEVYYVISGKGIMHIDDEVEEVLPGVAVYIPPEAVQFIHNPGPEDLAFICIVDPAWRKEDELIIIT